VSTTPRVGWPPTITGTYEARKFGVRSAMAMVEARRRAPDAIVVPPRMEAYAEASREVFRIMRSVTPLVEGLSLDEAFLDVTATRALLGDGETIAKKLKSRIREATGGLTSSVGVAACKFVAKVASDLKKPDGIVVVPEGTEATFLAPLAIERLWGVGPKTAERLHARGLRTIADVQGASHGALASLLGDDGASHLRALAVGDDPREVDPSREAKSIGSEETFERDLVGAAPLREPILRHAEEVARRLRAEGLRASALVLKVKRADHSLVTRRATADVPLVEAREIHALALRLLDRVPLEGVRTRLVGLSAQALEPIEPAQRALFADATVEKPRALGDVIDAIEKRFGRAAIKRAGG
jgi:DNA polymerase-4